MMGIDPNLAIGLGGSGIIGGGTIYSVYRLLARQEARLEQVIVPKLNRVCNRTQRTEIAQRHIIDALEDDGHTTLREDILDDIDMMGIPRQSQPIVPAGGNHR